jgi:tetratricopeptide (TPR) repeat protein
LSSEDRELLSSLEVEQQSFKAIRTDMAEIFERLGADKLLFVTHINATSPGGELIQSRDRLVRWVTMAADQLGARLFDPTNAMHEMGQENALERGGLDLTHYTPAFYNRVYDEMHRTYFAPLMGSTHGEAAGGAQDESSATAARLESAQGLGDFFAAARELHSTIAEAPDSLPLIELRGLIRSRIGDFSGAVADLTRRGDDSTLSQSMRVALVEALNATGDPARALGVAENLLAEEYESASMYRAAAESAERIGKPALAIAYAKQAFRADRDDLSAALHALVLLTASGSAEERSAWRSEILENIGESANGAFEICMWAIRNHDEELFASALTAVARTEKVGTVDLFEEAFDAGLYRGVARSIGVVAELGRLPRSVSERRTSVMQGSVEEARRLVSKGRFGEAFELADAMLVLEDLENSQIPAAVLARDARRLIKTMSQQVRSSIHEAYKERNSAEVLRIGEAAGPLLLDLPEGAVVFARSLHAEGRTAEALALMVEAQARNPGSFVATRWAAWFASAAKDVTTALDMYGAVRRSDDPRSATIAPEVDRFFARLEARALKELRTIVNAGGVDKAMRLAALIKAEIGLEDRVDRELSRLHSMLWRRLKEIDAGDGDADDRELVLRQLSRVRPSDQGILRRFALELMRQLRFAEAGEMWGRILALDPDNDSAARQRERCIKMARRRVAAWGGDLEAAA